MTGRGVSIDLVKRAFVGAGADGRLHPDFWIRELGSLVHILARASSELKFKGAPHIARNLCNFSIRVDDFMAGIDTSKLGLELVSEELREYLEGWARLVEGTSRPGRCLGVRIFEMPGWLLVDGVHLSSWKPGTSITTMQTLVVDATGVSWLDGRKQEQNFGGKYVLPLRRRDPDRDGEPMTRYSFDTYRRGGTWRLIVTKAYAHWHSFVEAVGETRVFEAMKEMGRDDLRTALWLSRPGPRGQYRRLRFAENLPELAAQMLPLVKASKSRLDDRVRYAGDANHFPDSWIGPRFKNAWRSVEGGANLLEISRHVWLRPRHSPPEPAAVGIKGPVAKQDGASHGYTPVDQRRRDPSGVNFWGRNQHAILSVWHAIDPNGLHNQTIHHPRRLVEVVSLGMRLLWEMGDWMPASVIVRAIRATGLETALRYATPERLAGLRFAVDRTCYSIFRPQLDRIVDSMGHPLRQGRRDHTVRQLVLHWLTLRFGTDDEIRARALARQFPDAAVRARRRMMPELHLRDIVDWKNTGISYMPEWLKEFDPDKGLIEKLYVESLDEGKQTMLFLAPASTSRPAAAPEV